MHVGTLLSKPTTRDVHIGSRMQAARPPRPVTSDPLVAGKPEPTKEEEVR